MQAYLKSALPYYGVSAPVARVAFRAVLADSSAAGPRVLGRGCACAVGRRHPPRGVVRRARRSPGPQVRRLSRRRRAAALPAPGGQPAPGGTSSTRRRAPGRRRCCCADPERDATSMRAWAIERRPVAAAHRGDLPDRRTASDTDRDLLSRRDRANLDDRDVLPAQGDRLGAAAARAAPTRTGCVRFVAAHDDRLSRAVPARGAEARAAALRDQGGIRDRRDRAVVAAVGCGRVGGVRGRWSSRLSGGAAGSGRRGAGAAASALRAAAGGGLGRAVPRSRRWSGRAGRPGPGDGRRPRRSAGRSRGRGSGRRRGRSSPGAGRR